LSSFYENLH